MQALRFVSRRPQLWRWPARPSLSVARYSNASNPTAGGDDDGAFPCMAPAIPASLSFPRISVAPMVAVTDVHFRAFARLVSSSVHLYSEMLPAMQAIRRPDSLASPVQLDPARHHLQLGGSSASELALVASFIPAAVESCPYGSININMGCPSIAAQRGGYGAVTMTDSRYPRVLRALRDVSPLPLSVKCRIGVDGQHSYTHFSDMVRRLVDDVDISHLIVHCRRAVLGLSPLSNRSIPSLEFDYARRIKAEWGERLRVEVNGGISSEADVRRWMADESGVDGLMIGRWAQRSAWHCLQRVDQWTREWRELRGHTEQQPAVAAAQLSPSREAVLSAYCAYIHTLDPGRRRNQTALLVRPLLSLWQGEAGGRQWRKRLVNGSQVPGLGAVELIHSALSDVQRAQQGWAADGVGG